MSLHKFHINIIDSCINLVTVLTFDSSQSTIVSMPYVISRMGQLTTADKRHTSGTKVSFGRHLVGSQDLEMQNIGLGRKSSEEDESVGHILHVHDRLGPEAAVGLP